MIDKFETERMQSAGERPVEIDMSESGVRPVTLRELVDLGFDMEGAMDTPLGYSQSNGTIALREALCLQYPGATPDRIDVTNGTSDANYTVALSLVRPGNEVAFETPNFVELWGVPRSLGATVRTFRLRGESGWEPDWEEFARVVTPKTRLLYISNPNNPTGSVLSRESMRRIVERCDRTGTYLLADEVYHGAEIHRERTPSFWGMSDRVIVTGGLSKAYGIPGLRVGWIVGPADVIAECWTQHDYLTIGRNQLSEEIARVAVRPDNREKLYARTRAILQFNLPIVREWAAGLGNFLTLHEPEAGALGLVRYAESVPSFDLSERIRVNRSTLIVPGSHLGLEGFIRICLGGQPEVLREGLRRIGMEMRS